MITGRINQVTILLRCPGSCLPGHLISRKKQSFYHEKMVSQSQNRELQRAFQQYPIDIAQAGTIKCVNVRIYHYDNLSTPY